MSNTITQIQKFGFIGSGHAGSRFVDTLATISDNAYPTVCFNSAISDLNKLQKIAPNNRIHIQLSDGVDGAGKDPKLGKQAVLDNKRKVIDKIEQEFKDVSMIYLTFSSGGGTGRGSINPIMEILDEMGKPFGLIMIEPFANEGYQPTINTFTAYQEISESFKQYKNCKGITLLDNQKIIEMDAYKNLSLEDFYSEANQLIARSFHLFNLSTARKGIENFDSRDYLKCLNAPGFMTMGTLQFEQTEIQNQSIFIDKLKENLEKNLFTEGLDIKTATHASLILFIPKKIIDNLSKEVLLAPFDEMAKMLDGATIFKGIYPVGGDQVFLYTLLSGMDYPRSKIKRLGSDAQELHQKAKTKVKQLKKTEDLFGGGMSFDLDDDDEDDFSLEEKPSNKADNLFDLNL